MSPDFGNSARSLLAGEDVSVNELAERAAQACGQLTIHLARLLGDTGVEVMLKRSIVLASARVPWLAAAGRSHDHVLSALRTALEQQDREAIIEAFVGVLTAFVGLLERLIGEGLVERLLEEVWPTVFRQVPKDTP